jgi:hypothetical protein
MALASYAKQMDDPSLFSMAQKIRDRAVQRGGKLLLQVKSAKGARTDLGGAHPTSRKTVAKNAGLSPDQAKQMIRVASVPHEKFEAMVERAKPATVEQLAEAGTKKSERVKPEPFRSEWIDWTDAVRQLATLPACGLDVLAVRRPDELEALRAECAEAIGSLKSWKAALEKASVSPNKDDATRGRTAFAH